MNKSEEVIQRLVQNTNLLVAIAQETSFTRAADQLDIDQSAVSHRVRALEAELGVTLFERTTRSLRLTKAGEEICATANGSLQSWRTALTRIGDFLTSPIIRLSVSSSLAMKWLVPALPKAQAAGLDIVVDVDDRPVDLHASEAHIAIRYGTGPYPGLHVEHLIQANLIPVIRPGTIAVFYDGETPLLTDKSGEEDATLFSWQDYFAGIGQTLPKGQRAHAFARADLALQAAISGMGIALGRTLLVENDLEAGFLAIAGKAVPSKARYWLVTTPAYAQTDGYQNLRKWLKAEMHQTARQPKTH